MTAILAEQLGRICEIDAHVLDRASREALTLPREAATEYGDFQSGGWQTLSLYNDSGDPLDATIHDCEARETTVLERMPATRDLLRSFGLQYMWVRIARLRPNSFLWEHRDYGELADRERYRLHIPLHTNLSAALVVGGARVHLDYGHMWRLVPTNAHGACNLTGPDRLHIIMDCYGDDAFDRLTSTISLAGVAVDTLPEPSKAELADHVDRAVTLARLGYHDAAQQSLLRLYYRYSLPDGMVYDLVVSVYERLGDTERVDAWAAKKKVMLGLE